MPYIKVKYNGRYIKVWVAHSTCKTKDCFVISSCNTPGKYYCRINEVSGCPNIINQTMKIDEPVVVNRAVFDEPRPYVCPVCNGTKHVPEGFYRQNLRGEWSSSGGMPLHEPCRSCNETGIVWH